MITLTQLQKICTRTPTVMLQPFIDALNDVFARREFSLGVPMLQAHFIAQAAHETMGFMAMRENLNYSADALVAKFPKYFTPAEAQQYARQPERIANRLYANRMGNGPEASGDGWLFRGGGIPHNTGRTAYGELSLALVKDRDTLLINPDLIGTPDYAVLSGAWYWAMNELYLPATRNDVDEVSDRIWRGRHTKEVGDSAGYEERNKLTQLALQVLS